MRQVWQSCCLRGKILKRQENLQPDRRALPAVRRPAATRWRHRARGVELFLSGCVAFNLRKHSRGYEAVRRFQASPFRGRQLRTPRIGRPKSRRSDSSTKGEADVDFKGLIAATASVALMVTPTLATAQTAAVEVAPAAEAVDD